MRDPNFGWIPAEIKLPGSDMDGEEFFVLHYYSDAYDIWSEDPYLPVILVGENDAILESADIWHEGSWYSSRYEYCEDTEKAPTFYRAMWWQPIIWPALPREEEILREVERLRNPKGKRAKIVDVDLMGWTPMSRERPGVDWCGGTALVLAYSEDRYEERAGIARPLVKLGENGLLEGKLATWCSDNEWHTDMPATEKNLVKNVLWWHPIVWPVPPAEPILYAKAKEVKKLLAEEEKERKEKERKKNPGWEPRKV